MQYCHIGTNIELQPCLMPNPESKSNEDVLMQMPKKLKTCNTYQIVVYSAKYLTDIAVMG